MVDSSVLRSRAIKVQREHSLITGSKLQQYKSICQRNSISYLFESPPFIFETVFEKQFLRKRMTAMTVQTVKLPPFIKDVSPLIRDNQWNMWSLLPITCNGYLGYRSHKGHRKIIAFKV